MGMRVTTPSAVVLPFASCGGCWLGAGLLVGNLVSVAALWWSDLDGESERAGEGNEKSSPALSRVKGELAP